MKILVTYATGFGSTAEVAEAIATALREHDEVVVEQVHDVLSVRPYDAVVAGSPVRAGKWLRSATNFLANCESELAKKPVAYFTLSLMARDEVGRQKVYQDVVGPIRERYSKIKPVAVGVFGGAVDYERLPWLIRLVVKGANKKQGLPVEGKIDYRDWNAITTWAKQLRSRLRREGDKEGRESADNPRAGAS